LQTGFHPWYYFLPVALALSIKENIEGPARSRILLLFIILIFGLYTLSRTKLSWYIVPLYPALALLTASMLRQAIKSYKSVAFSGMVVAMLMIVLTAPRSEVLMLGGAGILIVFVYVIRRTTYHLIAVAISAFCVIVGISSLQPLYNARESPEARIARIAHSTGAGDREPLILYPTGGAKPAEELWRPVPLFYSDRPIQEAYTLEELAGFASDHKVKRAILLKEQIESLSSAYEIRVLAEAEPYVYAMIKLGGVQ
jgi:hypothetical protein